MFIFPFFTIIFQGNFGGGSMNPARSFGPAIYNWNWAHQWIYWVAPVSASIVGTLLFRLVFYKTDKSIQDDTFREA